MKETIGSISNTGGVADCIEGLRTRLDKLLEVIETLEKVTSPYCDQKPIGGQSERNVPQNVSDILRRLDVIDAQVESATFRISHLLEALQL